MTGVSYKHHLASMIAAAAALASAPGAVVVGSSGSPQLYGQNVGKVQGGMQVPQGGIGSILGGIINGAGGFGGRVKPPRYTKHTGYSCAEGKRRASKARNKLRAKGQHRKAVR